MCMGVVYMKDVKHLAVVYAVAFCCQALERLWKQVTLCQCFCMRFSASMRSFFKETSLLRP